MKKEVIFGCMGLGGGWHSKPMTVEEEANSLHVLETAWELGYRVFDHADIYTFGKAESVFGKFLNNNPAIRSQIKIQTKAGIKIGAGPGGSNTYDLSKSYLIQQVEKSISQLRCDYLDVFMLHRADPLMQVDEVAEAFHELKSRSLVKSFGVSNFTASQFRHFQNHLEDDLVCNQIQFSLEHSGLLNALVEFENNNQDYSDASGLYELFANKKVELQAWGSLDRGKYLGPVTNDDSEVIRQTKQLLEELAHNYNTSSYAILIAWLNKLPFNVSAIVGTTNIDRLALIKAGEQINTSREDWYRLWITSRGRALP